MTEIEAAHAIHLKASSFMGLGTALAHRGEEDSARAAADAALEAGGELGAHFSSDGMHTKLADVDDTRPPERFTLQSTGRAPPPPVHARRRRVLPILMAKSQGVRAVTPSPATAGGSCWR